MKPHFGTGNQAVHFRVNGSDAMAVNQLVAHVIAVGLAGHGAVIAGAEDALVFDQDAADQGPVAGRPLGDNQGLHHKVLLPRDTFPGHLLAPVLK